MPRIEMKIRRKRLWISIKRADRCFFSRRNGVVGRLILGYSVCLRLFGRDIL